MLEPESLSKLPNDPAYWAGLEARIVAAARADGAGSGLSAWHAPLARGAWALATAAAAAGIAVAFIPRDAAATTANTVPALLAPSIAAAATLEPMLRLEAAPAIADLLRPPATGTPR
jgi:hypothetical protein